MQARYIKLADGSTHAISMAGASDGILWLGLPEVAGVAEAVDIFSKPELTKHMEAYFVGVEERYAEFDNYTVLVIAQKTKDGINVALEQKEEE